MRNTLGLFHIDNDAEGNPIMSDETRLSTKKIEPSTNEVLQQIAGYLSDIVGELSEIRYALTETRTTSK